MPEWGRDSGGAMPPSLPYSLYPISALPANRDPLSHSFPKTLTCVVALTGSAQQARQTATPGSRVPACAQPGKRCTPPPGQCIPHQPPGSTTSLEPLCPNRSTPNPPGHLCQELGRQSVSWATFSSLESIRANPPGHVMSNPPGSLCASAPTTPYQIPHQAINPP